MADAGDGHGVLDRQQLRRHRRPDAQGRARLHADANPDPHAPADGDVDRLAGAHPDADRDASVPRGLRRRPAGDSRRADPHGDHRPGDGAGRLLPERRRRSRRAGGHLRGDRLRPPRARRLRARSGGLTPDRGRPWQPARAAATVPARTADARGIMSQITVGELLVRWLRAEGVELVTGIIDGAHVPIVVPLPAYGIRYINARHEEAATHIAEAYARVARRPGVVI